MMMIERRWNNLISPSISSVKNLIFELILKWICLLDYAEFVDAALVGSRSSNKNKRGGTRGSPRARRWGRGGPRSLSPTRRVGGGFEVQNTIQVRFKRKSSRERPLDDSRRY